MNRTTSKTADELQVEFGERLRRLRIGRGLDQRETAAKAGGSEKALRSLETGSGSSLQTLLRVLKALDAVDALDAIAPVPTVSPLALLKRSTGGPQRVSRPRNKR